MIGHEAVSEEGTTGGCHYKVRNFVGIVEAGEDTFGCAGGVEEVVRKDLSKNLIITIVLKDILLVGATIVDVIVGTRDKNALIINAGH